ncbi:hypothetical protein [Pseudomonas sp. NPDC089401]|uniref:hypothetical protein n=1 Tax=Pseudomonas sp. NPDC089401 TaxID=3364462 RepID=UPI003816370D
MSEPLDFNKAALAKVVARYKAGERDPAWEHNPALTAALRDGPEYVQHADWMVAIYESMPEPIQRIVATLAKVETADVPENERKDAFMAALLRLLREWASRHNCP